MESLMCKNGDLISRQMVRLIESDPDAYPQEWNDDYEKGFTDALNKVLDLPSAQPEHIRCKDCKFYFKGEFFPCGISSDLIVEDDDYCSFAERKEIPKLNLASLYGKCVSDGQE